MHVRVYEVRSCGYSAPVKVREKVRAVGIGGAVVPGAIDEHLKQC